MSMKTAQARQARRSIALRASAIAVAWTALFAVLAATALPALWQKAAYVYADVSSPWVYVTQDEYDELQQARSEYSQQFGGGAPAGGGVSSEGRDSADGGSSADEGASADGSLSAEEGLSADGSASADGETANGETAGGASSNEGVRMLATGALEYFADKPDLGFWTSGALFAVRDLSGYHAFLDAGPEVAIGCYFCGLLVVALVAANRALRRLDDLSAAVTTLFADRFAPVELPDDLAATRAELVQIQNRALADERAAKAAETRKNELVAYLAHDIRTPLTSVIGYLSILKESPDLPKADRARLAGVALEKAERLEGLVGEFFEITRYDLQAIPIERERVGIALFLGQVAEELYPEAKARGLSVEVEAPEGATAFVDPAKMARAVSNVLRNAIAFAEEGSVVGLSAEDGEGAVRIRVSDTGKEISPAHLDAIFEKFFREDGARSSGGGGAGLGLAIAKEIVEAHGGTIAAESSLGRTVFTIAVPKGLV